MLTGRNDAAPVPPSDMHAEHEVQRNPMSTLFSWIPFYTELADRLLPWRDRQSDLIELLTKLRNAGHPVPELKDVDKGGSRIALAEIDPFTVFALFNRGMTDAHRRELAS